jgi:hypothetical protein
MLCVWSQLGRRRGLAAAAQLAALSLSILILLPVISVTDDLLPARNTAEIDSCFRVDHRHSANHCAPTTGSGMARVLFVGVSFRSTYRAAVDRPEQSLDLSPDTAPVQNRPPPEL